MDRMNILDKAESLFKEVNFSTSQRCCARPSCFDFVAKRDGQLMFVKAQSNIGNVYEKDACGLATLANLFAGTPLFVCEETRKRPLHDDTIYSRYGVGAVTLKTLKDALFEDQGPLIEAGPGGYYVRLDGDAIRKKRVQNGLSIGKMAAIAGVSRRTLYGYEREMTKASVAVAYKLERILGIPVVKPIDIFNHSEEAQGFLATAKRMISESRFLHLVIRKLLQLNFSVFQLKKAPFDFIAKTRENNVNLLGTIVREREQNLEARTKEVMSISEIVEAQPMFVTDNAQISDTILPFIHREDFENIKAPEELMAKL